MFRRTEEIHGQIYPMHDSDSAMNLNGKVQVYHKFVSKIKIISYLVNTSYFHTPSRFRGIRGRQGQHKSLM